MCEDSHNGRTKRFETTKIEFTRGVPMQKVVPQNLAVAKADLANGRRLRYTIEALQEGGSRTKVLEETRGNNNHG